MIREKDQPEVLTLAEVRKPANNFGYGEPCLLII